MSPDNDLYLSLPDGTLKHIHPITGTEVWAVPSRAARPFVNRHPVVPTPIVPGEKEDHCDFCEANYLRTPPERARLVRSADGRFESMERLPPDSVKFSKAAFRRLANLFEIITFDYWSKNLRVELSPVQARWKEAYLGDPVGLRHVQALMRTKLSLAGKRSAEIDPLIADPPDGFYDPFFGGTHEVLAAGRHFRPGALTDDQLFSSGDMDPSEHEAFFRFASAAAQDIRSNNPKVRYVAIFQNWLRAAGASFDHLHKQLVGLDTWGPGVRERVQKAEKDPSIFNRLLVDLPADQGLVIAENEHGLVLSEFGHPYPTLAIYSRSRALRPWEHSPEEFRGLSDLVHACHAASGVQVPCNEVWFYPPFDRQARFPWHILIHWRTVTTAGFEAGTGLFVNPVPPLLFKERIVERLRVLRDEGRIAPLRIGGEVRNLRSPLSYDRP